MCAKVAMSHGMRELELIIKQEYFNLVVKLNKGNGVTDLSTELYFYMESSDGKSWKLYAALNKYQRQLLCEKSEAGKWRAGEISEYLYLEAFIFELLQSRIAIESNELTKLIKSNLFKANF